MKAWNINIQIQVADSWVEDGFDAKERKQQIEDLISELLPYAYPEEFKIEVTINESK